MARPLKIAAALLGGVLLLVVGAIVVIAATFDPNAYKPVLAERMQAEYRRTLAIPGDIRLSFFPNLGVSLGAVSLSEPGSAERFVSLESARVSLAVMPLLQRRVVVDRVELRGLRARVVRFADGRTSVDDFVKPGPAAAAPAPAASGGTPAMAFDIAGLALDDAELVFDDRQGKRRVSVTKASLSTGHLLPGQPADLKLQARLQADSPALDTQLALKTRLRFDPGAKTLALAGLDATLAGRVATVQQAQLRLGGDADVRLDPLRVDLNGFSVAAQGQPAGAQLDATLDMPRLQFDGASAQAPKLALKVSLRQPGGTLALAAQGGLAAQLERQHVDLNLAGSIDDSRFDARLALTNFAAPAWRFDVSVDRLDLDRYRKPAAAPAAAPSAPAADKPLDLSALQALNGSGSLKVGALQASGLKLRALRADLKAGGGQLVLNPLAAELYEGRTSGSVTLQAGAAPRVALKQTLAGISLGPLLKDLLQRDSVEGRGDVVLDVTTQGATVSAMKRALAGSAKVALRDGAVRGFNIAQAIRDAKARLGGGGGAGTGNRSQSTDFSEFSASFQIAGGVAHNDDLQAKSPLLRVGGAGDIDLGAERLDYTVKATVVGTLKGQGGAELDALRGQTIPVRLSGPFSAVGWKIDFAGMISDQAKQKLEDKAKQKLGDKLKGLLGR